LVILNVMSSKLKFAISSALILAVAIVAWLWYYRRAHPTYVPPPPKEEITITIIPGWNLRQVAEYLVEKGIASTTEDVYKITGEPARDYRIGGVAAPRIQLDVDLLIDKPNYVSYEGYLAPETYRVYKDATVLEGINTLINQRELQITEEMRQEVDGQGRTLHQTLTMASILEKEVRNSVDKAMVADILWRRLERGWALQVDSSVHYAVDKRGEVFTKKQEREFDSYWNTYKYPGLPLGPISNPSIASIEAALHPEKNNYWYFLTTLDGQVKYARTLDEHNGNRGRYLR